MYQQWRWRSSGSGPGPGPGPSPPGSGPGLTKNKNINFGEYYRSIKYRIDENRSNQSNVNGNLLVKQSIKYLSNQGLR